MDAGEHDTTQDPGWRAAWSGLRWLVSPGEGVGAQGGDDLAILRALFVAMVVVVVGVGGPVTVLVFTAHLELTDLSTAPTVAVVVAVGLPALAFATRPPRVDCRDDDRLARSYRGDIVKRGAVAEAATLVGYAGSLATGDVAPYVAGAVCSLAALSRIAPTAAKLARDQQALTASGCPRSLIGALRRNANRPPR